MKNTKNRVNRKKLWVYINQKINRVVHHYQVFSVMSLLFEEMVSDLKSGKEIKVKNFGKFYFKKNKPVVVPIFGSKEKTLVPGSFRIKFKMDSKLRKILSSYLNFDKPNEKD